jgi:hypothetical protein
MPHTRHRTQPYGHGASETCQYAGRCSPLHTDGSKPKDETEGDVVPVAGEESWASNRGGVDSWQGGHG